MASLVARIKAGNEALVERRNILREVSEETERIVRAQNQGVQQVQALAEIENRSLSINRSEGGGGGGGLQNLGATEVIGLLVSALSSGGGGSGRGGPGFQAGAPSLRGASFARSLALGQFR